MEKNEFADTYILANANKFPRDQIYTLKERLLDLPEQRQLNVKSVRLINPFVVLFFSFFFGYLGIDRLILGDIGLGILKLILNFFVIGFIWTVIDWFATFQKAKQKNLLMVLLVI